MLKFAGRRLLFAIPLLIVVSFVVFCLLELTPGDPAVTLAGENPTHDRIVFIRHELRLDQPFFSRYEEWLSSAVHGDFGTSFALRTPVSQLLVERGAVTLSLTAVSLTFAVFIALILGLLAGSRPGSVFDKCTDALCALALSMPPFWLGVLLVGAFAINRGWFPALGYVGLADGFWPWLQHLILPALALGAIPGAEFTLQLKNSLREVMAEDFVFAAEARGLGRRSVIGRHALKSAAIPVVTVFGYRVAQMVGATVVVETVFALPGLGSLAVNSVLVHDIPVVLGIVVVATLLVVAVNLIVDVVNAYLNPKVRLA